MRNEDVFWKKKHAFTILLFDLQVLKSQDYNLVEKDEVFGSKPNYVEHNFHMLKSIGIAHD